MHWDGLHLKCHEILVEEFLRLGIFTGNYKEVLSSGISSAFFPHGLGQLGISQLDLTCLYALPCISGHSIGLDVHDVPSASKPAHNNTIPAFSSQNPEFYQYLRLRLPLEKGMCVVCALPLLARSFRQTDLHLFADNRTWMLLFASSPFSCKELAVRQPRSSGEVRVCWWSAD